MNLLRRSLPLALLLAGCASPGPPRPPSLHLPAPVTDLTALRSGDTVELRFTLPTRSTDKLLLPYATLTGSLCREVDRKPCTPALSGQTIPTANPNVIWHDQLPPDLTSGPPHLLAYRIELFNPAGHSAGKSDAAYTVAGQAPRPVENFQAQGSRLGIVLRWNPAPLNSGDVLLRREDLSTPISASQGPHPSGSSDSPEPIAKAGTPMLTANQAHKTSAHRPGGGSPAQRSNDSPPNVVWLNTNAAPSAMTESADQGRSLDPSALPGNLYRYTALRQLSVQIGGRSLELRSAASGPVEFTLLEIYPPAPPTGLTAAGFTTTAPGATPKFAVDLIWQPVEDAKLAGYNVYRQEIDDRGDAVGARQRLNDSPITVPGFHDDTARAAARYRYEVTSIDARQNESRPVTTLLQSVSAP